MIRYSLFPNRLTADPNVHMAIVQDQKMRTMSDIIDIMIGRGSTVTKAEAFSVIEEYEAAITQLLASGDSINTPLFRITASVSGVFNDQNDVFDRSRHYVRLNVIPGGRIGEIADRISTEKMLTVIPKPVLVQFKDVNTNTLNESITPGGMGELFGAELKVDMEDPSQGIFLIAADNTTTRVETVGRNKPANLLFMIPSGLPSGQYEIEVRAKVRKGAELRTGRLSSILTMP